MMSRHQLRRLRSAPPDTPQRLRTAMDTLRLTQEQLEDQSGVPQSTISKLLNGNHRNLSVVNAGRLARTLGCAVEDLFPVSDEAIAS